MKNEILIELLNTKSVRFMSIINYTNNEGEVSDYLININFSYQNAVQRDISFLNNSNLIKPYKFDKLALQEIIRSLIKPSETRSKGQKDNYTILSPSVKIHNNTGNIMVSGMVIKKVVRVGIDRKTVDSSELTIEKNRIRSFLRSNTYRNFRLDKISEVKLNGKIIEIKL